MRNGSAVFLCAIFAIALNYANSDEGTYNHRERLPSGPNCLGQCNDMFFQDLNDILGKDVTSQLATLSLDKLLLAFSNTTNFKLFCKIYQTHHICMSNCPASFFKEIFRQGVRIIDLHCVDRYKDIVRYFPCYGEIDSDDRCLRKCSKYQDSLFKLTARFKHLTLLGDTSEAEKLLGQSCEFMSCSLDCDIPRIRATCEEPLVTLIHDLVVNSFGIIHDIALGTGAIENWPPRCSNLQAYQIPPPLQEPATDGSEPMMKTKDNDLIGWDKAKNKTPKKQPKALATSGAEMPILSMGLILINCLFLLFK